MQFPAITIQTMIKIEKKWLDMGPKKFVKVIGIEKVG